MWISHTQAPSSPLNTLFTIIHFFFVVVSVLQRGTTLKSNQILYFVREIDEKRGYVKKGLKKDVFGCGKGGEFDEKLLFLFSPENVYEYI